MKTWILIVRWKQNPETNEKTDFLKKVDLDEISSDEDSDDDYDENMNKLEQDINKDILFNYHPETKQINFKELLTLSNVTRNKKGEIIRPIASNYSNPYSDMKKLKY